MTPYEVAELSEDQARALFRHYRFIKNGGDPFCPACGCDAVHEYRSRPIFKCKGCDQQFSLTSGTAFSYRKLSFKRIVSILAEFNIAYQGRSAREIRRNIRSIKNYKTVFIWIHKVRAALKKAQEARILSGEVEIDGAETGGYIRPKNTQKERSEFRKYPYRAGDRKMYVTLARERGGMSRAWVAKQEHHPVSRFMDCLAPDTVVFADKGKWGDIRTRFSLFQVPHKWTYYTPEACTNFAESGFNVFRVLETIHKRVSSTYLDLYAAQLAWRLDRVRMTDEEGLASIMEAMVNGGRSPLAGYFLPRKKGGAKRQCEIVDADGSTAYWAPPSAEERRRQRQAQAKQAPVTPTLRQARSKRWSEGFSFVSADDIISGKATLPAEPGVYALFFRDGDRLLKQTGYFPDPVRPVWERDGHFHLYTGESYFLKGRVADHLTKDIKASNLRETLLAIQWGTGALPGMSPTATGEDAEAGLSDWLRTRVLVGFKVCGYVREVERHILDRTASPLNIKGQNPAPYSALLKSLRERFRERAEEV